MLRTVAEDTPSPAAPTRSDEGTGSPHAMYSRTSAANTRLDRSEDSISTRDLRLLTIIHGHPDRCQTGVRWVSDTLLDVAVGTREKVFSHNPCSEDELPSGLSGTGNDLERVNATRRSGLDEELAVDDR